jgi:hypothetical protein
MGNGSPNLVFMRLRGYYAERVKEKESDEANGYDPGGRGLWRLERFSRYQQNH